MQFLTIYRLLALLLALVVIYPFYGSNLTIRGANAGCLDRFGGFCSKDKTKDDKAEVISVEKKGPEPLDKSQHPTELKISTEGSTTENDTDKYKVYKREGTGDTYFYKFNDQVKCTAIKCSDKEVWNKPTTDTAAGSCPNSFTFNKTGNSFVIYFGLEYIKFNRDNSNGSWTGGQRLPLITITTEDKTKSTGNDTKKSNVYKFSDETFTYSFNDESNCIMVKCSDAEVWKHTTDTDTATGSYPDSFTFNKTDSAFLLYFGLEYIKFTVDTSSGSWTGGEKQPLIKITTDGTTKENDTSKYKVSNLGDIYTYEFNQNVKCTMVTHDGKEVWNKPTTDTAAGSCPDSITYNKSAKTITLWFGWSFIKYKMNDSSDKWEESMKHLFQKQSGQSQSSQQKSHSTATPSTPAN